MAFIEKIDVSIWVILIWPLQQSFLEVSQNGNSNSLRGRVDGTFSEATLSVISCIVQLSLISRWKDGTNIWENTANRTYSTPPKAQLDAAIVARGLLARSSKGLSR